MIDEPGAKRQKGQGAKEKAESSSQKASEQTTAAASTAQHQPKPRLRTRIGARANQPGARPVPRSRNPRSKNRRQTGTETDLSLTCEKGVGNQMHQNRSLAATAGWARSPQIAGTARTLCLDLAISAQIRPKAI